MLIKLYQLSFFTFVCIFISTPTSSDSFSLYKILERLKRDDGAFLAGSGGPVAANSKGTNNKLNTTMNNSGQSSGIPGECKWMEFRKRVINKIAEGKIGDDKTYKYLGHINCKTTESCADECKRASCNYFFKSSVNGETHLYTVPDVALLTQNDWTESFTYDSFLWKC